MSEDEQRTVFLGELSKQHGNQEIDEILTTAYEATNRKFENDILRNEHLKEGIKTLRKRYDIKPSSDLDITFLGGQYTVYSEDNKPTVYPSLDNDVATLLASCKIVNDWQEYIVHYIFTDSKPIRPVFASYKTISIEAIENGEILVRLKPGLRREDYISVWRQLKPLLGEAKRLQKPLTNADENIKILSLKDDDKKSYSQIAKICYPNMDVEQAKDKVKKIVKRERIRLSGGDK